MSRSGRMLLAGLFGLLLLLLFVSIYCGGSNSLRGEITLEGEDETTITPAARVVVKLSDTSLADASSVEIARREYENVTMLPLVYELEWEDALESGPEYSVSARFYDAEENLIYINDTAFTVEPGDRRVDFHVIAIQR